MRFARLNTVFRHSCLTWIICAAVCFTAIVTLCVCVCVLTVMCAVLIAGNYAVTLEPSGEISAAAACPQKYYCPGGVPGQAFAVTNPAGLDPAEPSIKQCPDGSWTQERGAVAPEQCCEC